MLNEIKNINYNKTQIRNFGIILSIIFLFFNLFFYLVGKNISNPLLILTPTMLLISLYLPTLIKPIYSIWMLLAIIIGWIMTRIILIIMYYIILTPISLISRLFRKQFLDLNWSNTKSSFWNLKNKNKFNKSDYENQF